MNKHESHGQQRKQYGYPPERESDVRQYGSVVHPPSMPQIKLDIRETGAHARTRALHNHEDNEMDDYQEEFSETPKGHDARHKWAERYDDLNGAPESPDDR